MIAVLLISKMLRFSLIDIYLRDNNSEAKYSNFFLVRKIKDSSATFSATPLPMVEETFV